MIKKIIFFPLPFIFLLFNTTAQDALLSGNRIIGGGLSLSQSDNENDFPISYTGYNDKIRNSSYSFSPYYGRIYEDYTMVGVRFKIGGSSIERQSEDENSIWMVDQATREYGIGGFLRKYFPSSEKFGVFIQSGVDFGWFKSESEFKEFFFDNSFPDYRDSNELLTISGSIDAGAGLYFFILPQLTIETNLARFTLSYHDTERSAITNDGAERELGESSTINMNFNIINQFTFDKVFTLNYYF